MARTLFPGRNARKRRLGVFVAALLLAGCGGGGGSKQAEPSRPVRGQGFGAETPHGWTIRRGIRSVTARDGDAVVSVTVFPLVKRYDAALFAKVVPELDRVARQLAAREGARLASSGTEQVAGRDARVYELERGGTKERIAFVLAGRREFQLYCRPADEDACDLLFSSFRISA